MAKTIGLKIEIDGLSDITKEVVKLETEIKDLNSQLKQTEVGSDAYIDLRNEIAATTEALKGAKKEQKDFIKSANATKEAAC
jgi:phage-related minor tail protein